MFVLSSVQVKADRAGPARFLLVQERTDPPGVGTLRWTQVLKLSRNPITGFYRPDPATKALVYERFPYQEVVAAATTFLLSQDGVTPLVDTLKQPTPKEVEADGGLQAQAGGATDPDQGAADGKE